MPFEEGECQHLFRCGNEADLREGAPPSFCGHCGAALGRRIRALTDYERRWGEGKVVDALPPGHPDYIVGSERRALEVAKKYGISLETGTFKSETDRQRVWGDKRKLQEWSERRVGITPGSKLENRPLPDPHAGVRRAKKPQRRLTQRTHAP